MSKLRDLVHKRKQNKEIKKLYREEKKVEKQYKNENGDYASMILKYKNQLESDNEYIERFVDVSSFDENNQNVYDSQEQTLVFTLPSKEIRQVKHRNNFKRKKDENYDLRNSGNNIVELKNVSKYYISGKNSVSAVLKNLNLNIKRGEFVILFGKSGSGKSTLLNIISGLDRPTEGQVVVENHNLPYLSNGELTKFRREFIAFIFQQYQLLNNITGFENVETGLILNKNKKYTEEEIKDMFVNLDLEDVMHKYPSQMSGGQQQRISILRALAKDAEIIFADEPTGALDKKTGNIVMELLQKINREQGKTIIMVSHDNETIKYATRKITLIKGKIISDEIVKN